MRLYYEPGKCQEDVESHLYRVIDWRQCQCKARWRVGIKNPNSDKVIVKELCTRHKNDLYRYGNGKMIVSIEEIK